MIPHTYDTYIYAYGAPYMHTVRIIQSLIRYHIYIIIVQKDLSFTRRPGEYTCTVCIANSENISFFSLFSFYGMILYTVILAFIPFFHILLIYVRQRKEKHTGAYGRSDRHITLY